MNSRFSRRSFVRTLPVAGIVFFAAGEAQAQTVDEKDPTAVALGYVADASKVDKAKFPKFADGQHCGNCQLYQGKESDPTAPCAIFGGKKVAEKGWCNSWVKKA